MRVSKIDEAVEKKIKKLMPIMQALPSRDWVKECVQGVENLLDNQFLEGKKVYATKEEVADSREELKF